MTAPTAVMIKAGADWLREVDASDVRDPGYEDIALGVWIHMEAARATERWDDAVARELVGKRKSI